MIIVLNFNECSPSVNHILTIVKNAPISSPFEIHLYLGAWFCLLTIE
jgi:hypothetical protein